MPVKKVLVLGFAFVLLVGVGGCGSKADSLMKAQIKVCYDQADAIENSDLAKFQELENKRKEINKEMADLKLSDEETKKLREKYKDEFKAAARRIFEATWKNAEKLNGDFRKYLEDAANKALGN
jgi:hypothetical protein